MESLKAWSRIKSCSTLLSYGKIGFAIALPYSLCILGGVRVMEDELKMSSFMMDCKDPHELEKFYAALIKWEIVLFDEEYAVVAPPETNRGAYPYISFQRNPQYKSPVWPEEPEAQQRMAHIDFAVNDLEKAIQYAIHCGARMADKQFSDHWSIMFDPAGHPFCLCEMKSMIESTHFALL